MIASEDKPTGDEDGPATDDDELEEGEQGEVSDDDSLSEGEEKAASSSKRHVPIVAWPLT